jgi:RNase P/RNase MRP subunit p29
MVGVPFDGAANSAIISVVDSLLILADDVGLESEIVEEDKEALAVVLGQADKAMVERKRAVLDFLQDGLENNNIEESSFQLEEIHSREKSIGIGNYVVTIGK